jgi:hypothetical protein
MADTANEQVDNEINLEQLKLLKEIFEVRTSQMCTNSIDVSGSVQRWPCKPATNLTWQAVQLCLWAHLTLPAFLHGHVDQAADEDGSGELDIDEFCAKLGPHLGVNLKPQQVAQLFMKIDADAGGTVDW